MEEKGINKKRKEAKFGKYPLVSIDNKNRTKKDQQADWVIKEYKKS